MHEIKEKNVVRRNTQQREQVYAAVMSLCHPTARAIYDTLSRDSGISCGTVYRNLQILVENGEIALIETSDGIAHYDRKLHPHYHLYCRKCGGVYDTDIPYLEELDNKIRKSGFVVMSHKLCFEGYCLSCSKEMTND